MYPKNGQVSFNDNHYFKTNISDNSINSARDWLMYSESTNSLFCYPCCLFSSSQNSLNSSSTFVKHGINVVGFNDFAHQSRGIQAHEESQHHFQAVILWKTYRKLADSNKQISRSLQAQSAMEIGFWKEVLKGLLDAIIFLSKNNLALRGTTTDINSKDCGNFLSLVKLLSKYHPPLALHIERLKKGKTNYMSPQIQNEFIDLSAKLVRTKILEKIKERKYFSIMFDSTPDTSHKEQISQIIRSVSFNEDGCKIEEDFIDFINFDGKTGILLAEMILNKLKSDNLEIQNCRGQGYDNGANMSGKYRGVQARIHEINPLASFIPCAAHSLNLVGQHAASSFLAGKLILGQIQNLFTFFSASTSRWATLKKHVKKSLKGQSTTRWAARAIAVSTLLDEFKGVIIALEELINSDESNIQTVADASSNLTQICTFKFILGLNIWASILSRINEANIAIQSETTSLDQATKHIAGVVAYLEEFKLTGFESSVSKSEIIAEENGINQDSGFDYRKNRGNKPARFRIEES